MSGAHDESIKARHVGDDRQREALNRERALQPKMPQRTELTEMQHSHLRDDGGSDSAVSLVSRDSAVSLVSLVSARSRSRDTVQRSLQDKEKAIESQVRFRLDLYNVFAA